MAVNFEIFGIPYVMRVGIASLCTVYLVKCVGRGWCHVQWVQ